MWQLKNLRFTDSSLFHMNSGIAYTYILYPHHIHWSKPPDEAFKVCSSLHGKEIWHRKATRVLILRTITYFVVPKFVEFQCLDGWSKNVLALSASISLGALDRQGAKGLVCGGNLFDSECLPKYLNSLIICLPKLM